ncbi:LmbE-like protein [Trametes punicea]|nr:LmbE-like protein [Trametes punicea]
MLDLARLWLPLLALSLVWRFLSHDAHKDLALLSRTPSGEPANVLLLTAHPDDECMFFAPTVLALHDTEELGWRPNLYSLCLSVGNADGLGDVRRHELARSLDVLGIEDGRRWVIDSPDLEDNITARWEPEVISDALRPYVLQHNIDTILTFDDHGISAHPNHISLPKGVAHLLTALPHTSAKPRPRLFTLISVPLYEKYLGPISPVSTKIALSLAHLWHGRNSHFDMVDTSISKATTRVPVAVSGVAGYARALWAMMQHRSQLVWFRWLYVSFSRYLWVNEWSEIEVPQSDAAQ